ncbi:unnamed protein product, partial [marine sediment metagenome]
NNIGKTLRMIERYVRRLIEIEKRGEILKNQGVPELKETAFI